jgi:methanogenic corrinoid protein MtbC1
MLREEGHPIRVVARRVGLSPHVIRMWEKRYQAVMPQRTPTKRRIYSDADVERLALLCRAINGGRSIGQLAHLPTKKLLALVTADEATVSALQPGEREKSTPLALQRQASANGERMTPQDSAASVAACLAAVEHLDTEALESALAQAAVTLGQTALIEQVIVPLLHKIGELWRDGELRVAHEHLASAVVRTFLGNLKGSVIPSSVAPNLVVATPVGQLHELGALVVAAMAVSEGWRVTYLGANLPAEEIAGAAQQSQARAVALSLVYPTDDPRIPGELEHLHRYLAEATPILVGGRASAHYEDVLRAIGATRLDDMRSLRAHLETLRARPLQP